jgi:hypothetical protein
MYLVIYECLNKTYVLALVKFVSSFDNKNLFSLHKNAKKFIVINIVAYVCMVKKVIIVFIVIVF